MCKIAFVILNYGTYSETVECIESIRNHLDVFEYKIIIVDNGSKDDSYAKLVEKYSNSKDVDIIKNENNLGFAKGNNSGIAFARQNYNPEFIIVNNSDTEIFQDDLYKKLSDEYNNSHFALLGPMILRPDGQCNDSPWKPITIEEVERRIKAKKKEKFLLDTHLYYINKVFNKLLSAFGSINVALETNSNKQDFWKYQTQVELQGSFLVFSQSAFEYISGFDNRTFLYYEEQLLFLSLMKNNLTTVYDPRIAILHKVSRATKKEKMGRIQKNKFINKCNLDSLNILLETMRALDEEKK